VPWVRVVSCNPLELKDPELPPPYSGYPSADRGRWDEFRARYQALHEPLQREFSEFCSEAGAPPLPEGEFIHESPYLNLYLYPAEADYERSRPLGAVWQRLESSVREADERFALPAGDRALLYLSLGSLGSADIGLMQRLIEILGATDHRVIVSMGPQHDELALADNMVGAEFLPQPAILPHVDLVLTHGGNNPVTESLHFGKPMVVLPLFWDQHDNAQRMDELGLGFRLAPYEVEAPELTAAIDRLLADETLAARLRSLSQRLRAAPGTVRAAQLVEALTA
jgi:MGT family glycosyltransferase